MQDPTMHQSPVLPPTVPFLRRIHPVGFAVLSLVIVFFLYQVVGGVIVFLLFGTKPTGDTVTMFRVVTLLGQLLFILVPTLFLARMRYGSITGPMRIRIPGTVEIFVTVIAVFSLQQVLQGYMMFQDSIPLPGPLRQAVDSLKALYEEVYTLMVSANSVPEFIWVVVVIALVPAVCEELLFRGVVQRGFEETVGGPRGAIIAGIIFGAYHLNPISVVPLVLLGVFFGYVVYRSANISLAVSAHFFNNFVACTASFLQLNDEFVAIAPSSTPTAGLVLINSLLFAVVFLASVSYFHRLTADRSHE